MTEITKNEQINKQSINKIVTAEQLQFLRFCAFFLIYLWHADVWSFSFFPRGNGAANAVSFFFILSGVTTAYSSYGKKNDLSFAAFGKYIWKKISKLYPLYFVTTIFAVAYSGIPGYIVNADYMSFKNACLQLGKNLFMVQSWFQEGYFSYNGVGWFLSSIMFIYIVTIPIKAFISMIMKKNVKLVGLVFGSVIILVILYSYVLREKNMEFWAYVFPPARIFEYILGICIGCIVRYMDDKIAESKLRKIIFSILEVISLIIWIVCMYIVMPAWCFRIVQWVFPNLLLLTVFTFGKGIISEIFRFPFLRYLGDITFECFLIHQIVIREYMLNSGIGFTNAIGKIFSILFCLGITIMCAELCSRKLKKTVLDKNGN